MIENPCGDHREINKKQENPKTIYEVTIRKPIKTRTAKEQFLGDHEDFLFKNSENQKRIYGLTIRTLK